MGQEQKEHTWDLIAKKLAGEASPGELKELEDLLRAHPELYYPLQTIADFWNAENPGDLQKAERAFDRHLDRIKEYGVDYPSAADNNDLAETDADDPDTHTHSRRRRLLWITPLLLLTVTVVLFIYRSSNPARTVKPTAAKDLSEVATRMGSRTSLVLPDGTHVWLNAGSRITYEKNYGIDGREVNLTGEALFDVAHNASMPFVIHAAHVDIKVLGTRFNLKSYPTDKTTETTLLKGSIEVSIKARPNEKIILKPNEKLVIANDDSALHRSVSYATRAGISEPLVAIRKPAYELATGANIETAWVDDRLAFQDEEFAALAKEMERWYGVQIGFTQPTQETWRFTGSFQKETVQQALEALKLTAPFTYTIHENQITIYDK
jgi:ferric-dicitrate binding protein FerR (iron transport regulator)